MSSDVASAETRSSFCGTIDETTMPQWKPLIGRITLPAGGLPGRMKEWEVMNRGSVCLVSSCGAQNQISRTE